MVDWLIRNIQYFYSGFLIPKFFFCISQSSLLILPYCFVLVFDFLGIEVVPSEFIGLGDWYKLSSASTLLFLSVVSLYSFLFANNNIICFASEFCSKKTVSRLPEFSCLIWIFHWPLGFFLLSAYCVIFDNSPIHITPHFLVAALIGACFHLSPPQG